MAELETVSYTHLIVPCFSVMALAANGVIFFSDLETSVGDEFTITGTAVVSGDVIGDATIHMTYDPSYMRFEEGDGVNADTDGNLTFKGSGDGSSDRIEFTMKFQALQEGSTRLEQGDATVTDSAGSSLSLIHIWNDEAEIRQWRLGSKNSWRMSWMSQHLSFCAVCFCDCDSCDIHFGSTKEAISGDCHVDHLLVWCNRNGSSCCEK